MKTIIIIIIFIVSTINKSNNNIRQAVDSGGAGRLDVAELNYINNNVLSDK